MELTDYVLIALLALIVILEGAKLFLYDKSSRDGQRAAGTGISMTVGSRDVQEDQAGVVTTEAGTMAVLADGAGKAFGGRIASRTAVETFVELFRDYNAFYNPQYYFKKAFQCANKEILKNLPGETYGSSSAGCVLLRAGYLYYAVVGNVKVCVFRDGSLVPVSTGHTVAVLAEEKFREGKISRQAALALLENQRLYNTLGRYGFRDVELFDAPVRLKKGDIVALMSDGIYGLLGFKEIEDILKGTKNCQEKAFEIIELVNRNPDEAKDNASIVLLGLGNGVKLV